MLRQLLLLCLLLSTIQTQAEDLSGVQYVRAYDADTITVNLKDLPPVLVKNLAFGWRYRGSRDSWAVCSGRATGTTGQGSCARTIGAGSTD